MSRYDYDLIVIGAGAAGFVASKLAAGMGKRVAMIEKGRLGGECTNYGCVPSKTLIKAANALHQMRRARDFGLTVDETLWGRVGTGNVLDHVRSVVQRVYDGHPARMFENLGIKVMFGHALFRDNHTITINGATISATSFILAMGSSAFIPPIEGVQTVPYLTNETIFDLPGLPGSLIVLGGGPIGTELTQAFVRLGVDATIVEMADQILAREDREVRDLLASRLVFEGVKIRTRTKAVKLSQENGKILLAVEDEQKKVAFITADAVLVAVGRKANVDGLDLEKAGVEHSPKGVKADAMLRTSSPNIFAAGDVVGPYQFSHMAEYQARIAAQNALLPIKKRANYEHYGWCMFTDPELAHVGLTEEEARERHGDKVRIYRWAYKDTDRGKTDGEEFGMSKLICDAGFRIIGAHILGARAGDLIHEAQVAKMLGIPLHKLDSVIHIYPTFTDAVKQPAKLAYIDHLQENPVVKLLSKLFGKKR
jgi:pyruvate/2-oxoglutarate dehydrogenase complex dihydrolipoamide dehydrogenase (E3) component